jgi:hypothetical protein
MRPLRLWALFGIAVLASTTVAADEGLWPMDDFPAERVEKAYGFRPDGSWMKRLRGALVDFDGCSGTFVSANGLVLTSEHCVQRCLEKQTALRRNEATFGELCRDAAVRRALPLFDTLYCARLEEQEHHDSLKAGLLTRAPSEEVPCPGATVRQLLSTQNVTDRVKRALEGVPEKQAQEALQTVSRELERECRAAGTALCDVNALYGGAQFELAKYRVYRDVRVAFVPEQSLAEFGVERTNFYFPRHSFPASFIRIYENGRPVSSVPLRLSEASPREGQLVFLGGTPATTSRMQPAAALESQRNGIDVFLPVLTEARGLLRDLTLRMDKPNPMMGNVLKGLDLNIQQGRANLRFLSPQLIERRRTEDRDLKIRVLAQPRLKSAYANAWDVIDSVWASAVDTHLDYTLLEDSNFGMLFSFARTLVRAADERQKPNNQRLWPFTDQALPETESSVLAPYMFDEGLDTELLALYFRILQEQLGDRHPVVKKILSGRSPDAAAHELVSRTSVYDIRARKKLWTGGKAAIDASNDPLIALLREIDPATRAIKRRFDEEVEGPLLQASRAFSQARFEVYGASRYPDGNGTTRLRYGKVQGYSRAGSTVAPMTELSGLFGLATGRAPFELPERWLQAKPSLELSMPLNFCADTDGVFGTWENSDYGSPLLDKDLQVVGMAVGGNEAAQGAPYAYDAQAGRTVALNVAAILHVLQNVYHADRLVEELRAPTP